MHMTGSHCQRDLCSKWWSEPAQLHFKEHPGDAVPDDVSNHGARLWSTNTLVMWARTLAPPGPWTSPHWMDSFHLRKDVQDAGAVVPCEYEGRLLWGTLPPSGSLPIRGQAMPGSLATSPKPFGLIPCSWPFTPTCLINFIWNNFRFTGQ